jgi:hypothetical protein
VKNDCGILRARGLPYGCEEADMKRFFQNYDIVEDGIKLVTTKGKLSGQSYIIFKS